MNKSEGFQPFKYFKLDKSKSKSITQPIDKLKFITLKFKTITANEEEFEVQILKKIGSGTYSDVYEAKNITAGISIQEKMAIKCYRLRNKEKGNKPEDFKIDLIEKAKKEVEILKKLVCCQNVCKIIGYSEQENLPFYYCIAMEFGECTLKEEWQKKKMILPLQQISEIFLELVSTFVFFQETGIIHSDLKPSNVLLVKENGKIHYKMIDFNSSLTLKELADKSIENSEEDIEIPIMGTPFFMCPEYLKILTETLELNKLLKNSEKEYFKNEEETFERETMFTIKGKKFLFKDCGKKKNLYGESGACKNDMFSLGLMVLRLSGLDIKDANCKQEILNKLIIDFKKKVINDKKFEYLSKVIDKILEWNHEKRYNFIDLKTDLVARYEKPIENLNNSLTMQFETFANISIFSSNWISEIEKLDENLLENYGYKCFCLSSEFYDLIIRMKSVSNLSLKFFKEDVQTKFSTLFDITNQQMNYFLDILNSKDYENDFEKLSLIYSLETNFYSSLNKALSLNKFSEYENFVQAFIKAKAEINYKFPQIEDKMKVYRGISLKDQSKKDDFNKHINQYVPGLSYHWPCFSSCTKKLEKCKSFLNKNNGDFGVIFEIELNKNNKNNKVDLEKYSFYKQVEREVLLLPYFKFDVISRTYEEIGSKVYTKILLKEVEGFVLNYKFIWFDELVNNQENIIYQKKIRKNNSKVELIVFDDVKKAVDFIETMDYPAFVMSSGSKGKDFFGYIHQKPRVVKLFIFTSQKSKSFHEEWAKQGDFDNKLVGVFDKIDDILTYLPDEKTIY